MNTHRERERAMAGDRSSREVQILLEAITSSDVVESRVQLLTKLGDSAVSDKSDLASLIASLTMFWEDFTCLDISQCMLNKTVLHVAAKNIESDISGCLGHFLSLGIKASVWCGKHLNMTLMSIEDSEEEEHRDLFFQLLLDLLRYSAACFSALARYPISDAKELMDVVEKCTFEQLNLAKISISEVKRLNGFGLEVLKAAQLVLEAVIKLCKVYSESVNLDFVDARARNGGNSMVCEEADKANHVLIIIKCTVKLFCELGVLAANDGGSLVTLLNSSWKGVVTLLQLGKGAFATNLNVADILLTLVSLVTESLRCAAETWFSLLTEKVSVSEAKRIFLPVKFYLINAVRISSQYPCQAFSAYKEIALCVLIILTFRIFLSKEELLTTASEVVVEILEPVSLNLLTCLLNSAQLKQDDKLLILDWLFNENDLSFVAGNTSNWIRTGQKDAIFSLSSGNMHESRMLLLGRVSLFLNLVKSAPDLENDARLGIVRKLGWLLDVLVDEEVYCSCLTLQIPTLYGPGKAPEVAYQSMFFSILHALKTFMVVISSSIAWTEMESFLLQNIFHPHFLCWEIVMELWCFLVRHAEVDMVNDVVEKLCALLTFVASRESVLVSCSGLRKIARSICMLLIHVPQPTLDQVYSTIIGSQFSSIMLVALLMEGFPLNLLSPKIRSIATQRIVREYFQFMESFGEASSTECGSCVFGAPVFALSAALQSLQVSVSDMDMKTLGFLVAVVHRYTGTAENLMKHHYRKLLSETLGIISNVKHLYTCDGMAEVILELRNLFISQPAVSDTQLYLCKPSLAAFMAGLGHTELAENDSSCGTKSSAVLELYHMLLGEQHWAFVHLAIETFGYFAARTSCSQLWRFIPQNAALSFDLDLLNEPTEERFLAELKVFLEKERALQTTTPCSDEFQLLVKEGQILIQVIQNHQNTDLEAVRCENMGRDADNQSSKRRKLPDGIMQGVELLQNGLKVIGGDIAYLEQNHFDRAELHDKFLTHLSHLEQVIEQLVGLAGSV